MKKFVFLSFLLISLNIIASPKKMTMSMWQNLNESQRLDLLTSATYNDEKLDYTNYKVIEYKDHSLITNIRHKNYILEVYNIISDLISFDDIDQRLGNDSGYGIITTPIIYLRVLVMEENNEILGTYASIHFQGAYKEDITNDDSKFYFISEQEAIKFGFDPNQDVSWSGELYFNQKATPFSEQYLSLRWSGW